MVHISAFLQVVSMLIYTYVVQAVGRLCDRPLKNVSALALKLAPAYFLHGSQNAYLQRKQVGVKRRYA